MFEGAGLHTGRETMVTLSPLRGSEGVCFAYGGNRYSIREARTGDAPRNTTMVFPGGQTLSTVEHLLSAISGLELDDVLIEPDGPELPAMDGSALLFARRMSEIGFIEKDLEYRAPSVSVPVCVNAGKSGIAALPSDELRFTYVIDYPGTSLGTEMKDVVLTRATFLEEIAPARTFALLSEVEALRASGLALGGALDNAIVIGDDGPLNECGYRVERECAAHKILDLLGDLALCGFIARAHYICVCGGHKLHSKLADRLRGLFSAPI
jgi:UDP-3-O-[3-hydroxymyristoyl] N-acetylglucosamine deacetylase